MDFEDGKISSPTVELVASTKSADNAPSNAEAPEDAEVYYTHSQWSADGTTIIASSSNREVDVYVLPQDLLEERPQVHHLAPQSTLSLPEWSCAVAPAPYFSLQDPTSQLLLVGCKDHPIQLYHAFPNQPSTPPVCAYKPIQKETEELIKPASLLWHFPGTHFLVGSYNRLDYFDLSRSAFEEPIVTIHTIPSRRHRIKGGGVGMKGIISSLAAQAPDQDGKSLISAGTWSRSIGLYDLGRSGSATATWSISDVSETEFGVSIGGNGIAQTMWSPCGRYLVINERDCRGLLVYDIRGTGRPLSVLIGRASSTQQRLYGDVFSGTDNGPGGFEVWTGTQDGLVLVWEGIGNYGGSLEDSWTWNAHSAPIGSTTIHPNGSVIATCAGAWEPLDDQELYSMLGQVDESGLPTLEPGKLTRDRSLRLWKLSSS
jgi:telomerase Cajal body protein 1